jgi:hypothetical protein
MVELLRQEHGLAWTAHPRIKSSNWTPDAYKDEDFFQSPLWLGAAWKAMPADLSEPRLGRRSLDLLNDMANWGRKKYVLGEVDVFRLDHTHELYGHMNVNYLTLDRAPTFDEDWSPVLDALRGGKFFVTTGEVLLHGFTAGGKPSGATITLPADGRSEVAIELQWTFPMGFAEIVSGDGQNVYRERIDLSETPAFGKGRFTAGPDLSGRTWVRVEAWDVAANGAFSQPVWVESGGADFPAPRPTAAVRGVYGGVPDDPAALGVNAVWVGSGGLARTEVERLKRQGIRVFAEFNSLHDAAFVAMHPDAAPVGVGGKPCPPPDDWQGVCPTHEGYRRSRMDAFRAKPCPTCPSTESGSTTTTPTRVGNRPGRTCPTRVSVNAVSNDSRSRPEQGCPKSRPTNWPACSSGRYKSNGSIGAAGSSPIGSASFTTSAMRSVPRRFSGASIAHGRRATTRAQSVTSSRSI